MTLATNYSELQSAAVLWSGGSSDSNYASIVRDAIALAEFDMDRTLWVPERIKRLYADCTGEYESLPDDCSRLVAVKRIVDGAEIRLTQQDVDVIPGLQAQYTGDPRWYALVGAQVQFAPKPTVAAPMRARFIYYGLIPRLASAAPCTAVLTTYGNVYLWRTLEHLASYADDANGVAKWAAKAEKATAEANRAGVMRDATLA
jgi:hypothetical protein